MKQNSANEKGGISERFERQVFRTLVEQGHIIPEKEAEVREAEERLAKGGKILPETLREGRSVLTRIRAKGRDANTKVVTMPQNHFAEAGEELARAARKGSEISPAIEDKMRRNRAKADADSDTKSKGK